MQNGYIERFNKSYREGVLDTYQFQSIDEVREITQEWIQECNNHRPHNALGVIPSLFYKEKNN